jgi:hypothetical protein
MRALVRTHSLHIRDAYGLLTPIQKEVKEGKRDAA